MELKAFDSPEGFYKTIPTNIVDNIKFRIDLHSMLAVDKKLQQIYLELCRRYYPIVFNSCFWTYNPQKPNGERNQPFILRLPSQLQAVEKLDYCITNGKDVGINKSRKQGASELCCKMFAAKALLENESHFIVGSRKKEYVDNFGDKTTLFAKVDNVFDNLPSWWLELSGYNPKIARKDMSLNIPATGSAIVGDTTNENFSAGSRGTAVLLDEFGRVDLGLAEAIEGSVHDVANCIIYSSTHWLGANHTFNKCLHKSTTELIELMWFTSPEENYGMYDTPEPGKIIILDKEYYPEDILDDAVILSSISDYNPNETKYQFVADGLKGIPSPHRSPWFDYENYRRRGNKRDFICNVCGSPIGASDSVFDHTILEEVTNKYVRPPFYEGEVLYATEESIVQEDSVRFYEGGQRRIKWWGELKDNRPNQQHNYIVGIDPSYGMGSANSAIHIYDVNEREQVGSFVDANTKPEDLADIAVAMCYWIGGVCTPFMIWEANGGCGVSFGDRVVFQQYPWYYTQRREDSKTRKITNKIGCHVNDNFKEQMLGNLAIALGGGLNKSKDYLSIIIHEEELVSELADYIFKEKGKGIVASSRADLGTGAAERHGDRAIAAALCVLGCKEQVEGSIEHIRNAPTNSFMGRYRAWEDEQEAEKEYSRRYLY